MGPIAAVLYVLSDKEPAPGTHEEFIRPLWKQALGSTIHCVAGDATGIILAATISAWWSIDRNPGPAECVETKHDNRASPSITAGGTA